MTAPAFEDRCSAVAEADAQARPECPAALFDRIAPVAPARRLARAAACGSAQATGVAPIAVHAAAVARARGAPDAARRLRWPLSVRARRKP